MTQIGIVENLNGNYISVRIVRATSCGSNCVNCSGNCDLTEKVVTAMNKTNAKKGDRVKLEMSTSKVLITAFFVYIVPIIILACGYFVGDAILGIEWKNILFSIVCMISYLAILCIIDRFLQKKYTLIAVDIL